MTIDRRLAGALLALLVVVYLMVGLRHLGTVPPVHEDEPWQASVGWKLATDGILGSDLFAGFHGMERRYYGFMPLHPMLLATVFRIAGVGLVQARLEALGLGLLVVLLTARLAAVLFDRSVAVAAVAALLLAAAFPVGPFHTTGILLVDVSRIARYDIAVAVFGTAALLLWLGARRRDAPWLFAAAGVATALAGLSHLYGFFWLPILLLLGLMNRDRPRRLLAVVGGCVVTLLPYLVFVLSDLPTWAAQTRQYADRIALLDPSFYLHNLWREPARYLGGDPLRPGWWLVFGGLPVAVGALLWRGIRNDDAAARAVALPALLLPLMLALLDARKSTAYLVVAAPMAAVAIGWGAVGLWRAAGANRRRQLVLLTAALVVVADGAVALLSIEGRAGTTTPYRELAMRLRAEIPESSTTLVLHRYWFGLEDRETRSWWVPLALADPEATMPAVALADSLDRIAPDVLVVDDEVGPSLRGDSEAATVVRAYVDRHRLRRVTRIEDRTYGVFEIYRRAPLPEPDIGFTRIIHQSSTTGRDAQRVSALSRIAPSTYRRYAFAQRFLRERRHAQHLAPFATNPCE